MKTTYLIKFVVAFVATLALIGLPNSPVQASTVEQAINGDIQGILGIQEEQNIEEEETNHDRENDLLDIEDLLQKENSPLALAIRALIYDKAETDTKLPESKIETPIKESGKPAVSISNQEKDLFSRLVEAEAKGEPYEGKVAVAEVVLNRVDSPEFPDTVTDVIHQEVGNSHAFSPVQNGEINKPASDESKQAVDEALTKKDSLNDSIYFYNPDIATDNWIRSRGIVKTIGNHVFAK